jgi:hypothetical protein
MPNVDSATGFYYEKRFSDEHPPITPFQMAESTTLNVGDAVTLTAGYLVIAATTDSVLGVVLGATAIGDSVYDQPPIVAGAGETPWVDVILALQDVVFRVHDNSATPGTPALIGKSVPLAGTTGVMAVDSSGAAVDCMLLALAGPDTINENAYGADMQWLIIFQNPFIVA